MGKRYSVNVADDDQRTMSVDDIVRAYEAGEISGETYVWAESMDDWHPIANVPELKALCDARAQQRDTAPGVANPKGLLVPPGETVTEERSDIDVRGQLVRTARVAKWPVDFSGRGDSVPMPVRAIIEQCLNPDPRRQYDSAKQVENDLRIYLRGLSSKTNR